MQAPFIDPSNPLTLRAGAQRALKTLGFDASGKLPQRNAVHAWTSPISLLRDVAAYRFERETEVPIKSG